VGSRGSIDRETKATTDAAGSIPIATLAMSIALSLKRLADAAEANAAQIVTNEEAVKR